MNIKRLYIGVHPGTLRTPMRSKVARAAIFLGGLWSLSAVATGCDIPAKIKARDLVREGNNLYKDAKFEKAIEAYDASLELEPDGVTVLWNRACAAESIVLQLKEAEGDKALKTRKKYADRALADFQGWYDGLDIKDEKADKEYKDHRLAVLSADSRCDDLIAHWLEKHRAKPQDEGLYSVIARTYEETCGKPEKADEWFVKRTEDFPKSAKAWYSLAVRRFDPLFPDPESGLPWNEGLASSARAKVAEEVIGYLNKATEIDPNYRDPYIWRAMAYTQRRFTRVVPDLTEMPEEKLEALLAREDSLLAWKEQKAACDIDKLPECPTELVPASFQSEIKLFSEEKESGPKWKDKEVAMMAKVQADSVRELDATSATYEFRLILPAPAELVAPKSKKGKSDKDKDKESEGHKDELSLLVHFTFAPPAELPEDATDEDKASALETHKKTIEERVALWKEGKSARVAGRYDAEKKVLVVKERPVMACCPPPPLTDEEIAADQAQKTELLAQIEKEKERFNRKRGG